MQSVGFFTPITHQDTTKQYFNKFCDAVEGYLYIAGKRAFVMKGTDDVVISRDKIPVYQIAIKVISYMTVALPILALIARAAIRCIKSYKVVDMEKELKGDLEITEEAKKWATMVIESIKTHKGRPINVQYIGTGPTTEVFCMDAYPQYIFKLANLTSRDTLAELNKVTQERFENTLAGKAMVKAHNLGLMVIPRTAKIELEGGEGRKYEVIVEERLDIEPSCSKVEDEYMRTEEPLHETVRQLTKFCIISGFADVAHRNIPLLKKPDGEGRRQVGLIDLEHMGNLNWAVNGDGAGSCGVFRCMGTEKQLEVALKEAKKYGVKPKKETLAEARENIKLNHSLAEFHAKRGIKTGFEPIELTEEELQGLGLDLERTCDTDHGRRADEENFTMRDAIVDLLEFINRQFKADPHKDWSFKSRRHLTFEHASGSAKVPSYRMGKTWEYLENEPRGPSSQKSWLDEIVEALIDKGYIHSKYFFERHNYWCAYA